MKPKFREATLTEEIAVSKSRAPVAPAVGAGLLGTDWPAPATEPLVPNTETQGGADEETESEGGEI